MIDYKEELAIYKEALENLANIVKKELKDYDTSLSDLVDNDVDIAKVFYNNAKKKLKY